MRSECVDIDAGQCEGDGESPGGIQSQPAAGPSSFRHYSHEGEQLTDRTADTLTARLTREWGESDGHSDGILDPTATTMANSRKGNGAGELGKSRD